MTAVTASVTSPVGRRLMKTDICEGISRPGCVLDCLRMTLEPGAGCHAQALFRWLGYPPGIEYNLGFLPYLSFRAIDREGSDETTG